jgi:broad specificity phosphatase PhoE
MENRSATEVLLVRHGHVESTVPGSRFETKGDPPLSELGRAQAATVARGLAREQGLTAIYTSPLRRAMQTAQIIEHRLGLHPIECDDLREWGFGSKMGLLDRIRLLIAILVSRFTGAHKHLAFFWSHSPALRAFTSRVVMCLEDMARQHPGERIIVVAHAGTIDAILGHYFPKEEEWVRGVLRHCSITRVLLEGGTAHMLEFNRVFSPEGGGCS